MLSKNFEKKKFIGLIALSVLSVGGISFKLSQDNSSNKDITEFTIAAERGSLPGLITASGELKANKSVNVSPKRQGRLDEIFVEEGDQVKKGDLIAKMDFGDLEFRIDEIKANYETQKASFKRREMLFNEGAISAEEYEEYKNKFLKSKARFKQKETPVKTRRTYPVYIHRHRYTIQKTAPVRVVLRQSPGAACRRCSALCGELDATSGMGRFLRAHRRDNECLAVQGQPIH